MRTINLRDGKIKGSWNEKFYDSKMEGRVKRIYVGGDEWNLTQEEYNQLVGSEKELKKLETSDNKKKVIENYKKLDFVNKMEALYDLLNSTDFYKEMDKRSSEFGHKFSGDSSSTSMKLEILEYLKKVRG